MKTVYRYIRFYQGQTVKEHPIWICRDRSTAPGKLGACEYYREWKQYVFNTNPNADFSADCLDDISHFLKQLNEHGKS